MEIYSSNFQTLTFDEAKKILIEVFTENTTNYTDATYKADFLSLTNEVMKLNGKKQVHGIVVDMQKLGFILTPELQEWHGTNIIPNVINLGLRKMAVVVNDDVFVSISAEMTLEESKSDALSVKYFTDVTSAKAWAEKV